MTDDGLLPTQRGRDRYRQALRDAHARCAADGIVTTDDELRAGPLAEPVRERVHELRDVGASIDSAYVDVSMDLDTWSVRVWRVKDQPLPDDIERAYETAARGVTLGFGRAELSNERKAELDRLVEREASVFENLGIRLYTPSGG